MEWWLILIRTAAAGVRLETETETRVVMSPMASV